MNGLKHTRDGMIQKKTYFVSSPNRYPTKSQKLESEELACLSSLTRVKRK